ncbi:MAG TPA: LamG domain-containing protein [Thermoanaerobaculia bacterium]|jgi:hypothetical protein|nr:LamG domain-containing protein [Thermoanaerobaculia bacterium]
MRIVWTLTALLAISFSVAAQPANQYLQLQGSPQHGYIEIPADVLLDTPQMTVEAWVSVRDNRSGGCSSIAGNGYVDGWWLGLCATSMRSYFNGIPSIQTGGIIPDTPDVWIHIAAVTDGVTRRHYINGKLVLENAETAPSSTSTRPIRIGSDPDWGYTVQGGIDDLRIWKVARTQEQIRQTMYALYVPGSNLGTGRFESLEAWYRFEGNAMDSWRTHHGTVMGAGIGFATGAVFTQPRRRAAGH